jgi:hypothetical protein
MSRRTTRVVAVLASCVALTVAVSGCATRAAAPPTKIAAGHLVALAAAPADAPSSDAPAAGAPAAVPQGQRPAFSPGSVVALDERVLRMLPRPAEGRVVADVVTADRGRGLYTLRVVSSGLRMPISTTQPGVALTLPPGSLLKASVVAPTAQAGKAATAVDTALLRVGAHVSLRMRAGARAGSPYVEIVSVALAPAGAAVGGTGK